MPDLFFPMRNIIDQSSPIVFCRRISLILLATCSWANVTFAQTGADPSSPVPGAPSEPTPPAPIEPVTNPGATSAGETVGKAKAAAEQANPAVEPAAGAKPKSPFRFGESDNNEPTVRRSGPSRPRSVSNSSRSLSRPGISETPVVEDVAPRMDPDRSEERGPGFVAPGLYGQGQQFLNPGEGRLAQPRFRYGISVASGYDDNTFQTPDKSVTGVAQGREGSGFSTIGGHWDVQWAKPRTVFTLDVNLGATLYWNRSRDTTDFNNRLAMTFVHRIDPRNQFSANVNFGYLSQPDYANVYASQSTVGGDYITSSSKFDLLHRWGAHFSTNTSFAMDLLYYTQGSQNGLSNSYLNYTFGNEFRFSSSPRLTWVLEGRYGLQRYIDNSNLDSDTAFILGGVDWAWSRRLSTTMRAGAAIRSFSAGGSTTSPYMEATATYQTSRRSALSLNTRYGYEQQNFAGTEDIAFRIGMQYRHALSPKLSGDLGFNFIHLDSSPAVGTSTSTDTYDFNIGIDYRVSRQLSLGARYFYTQLNSSTGLQDYDRNRINLSANYEF